MSRRAVAISIVLAAFMVMQPLGFVLAAPTAVGVTQPQLYGFTQYQIPQNSSQPGPITADSAGNIWFVEQQANEIASFNPSTRTFTSYPIPTANSLPQGIAVDAQGNVWFAELVPSKLGELSAGSSTIHEIAIPPGPEDLGCGPIGVTPHAGSVWIACEFSDQIDEYSPASGSFEQFDVPLIFSAPLHIVFDKLGNFWFTAADVGMLGYATVSQLQPGTSDGIDEFAPINASYITTIVNPLLPGGKVETSLSIPSQLVLSPDGDSLWVTEHGGSSFDRYEINTKSLVKYFTSATNSSSYPNSLPNGIAIDGSGDVWVAEHGGNKIAELDPSTGAMTEYLVPCCESEIAGVLYLTLGENGTIWFTELFGNAIGELSPSGGVSPALTSLAPSTLDIGPTAQANVSVSILWGTSNQEAGERLSLQASGVTDTGELQNMTAEFDPAAATIGGGSTAAARLEITTSGLNPGVYDITIGAFSTTTGVISSSFLVLKVTQGSQNVLLEVAVIASAVVIVCALLAVRRLSLRGRRSTALLRTRILGRHREERVVPTPGTGQAALIALLALYAMTRGLTARSGTLTSMKSIW